MKNLSISAWGAFAAHSTSYASINAIINIINNWRNTADNIKFNLDDTSVTVTATWSIEGQFREAHYTFRNENEFNTIKNLINDKRK